MFTGDYRHAVDTKGRLSLPAEARSILSERYGTNAVVVTRCPADPCLWAFAKPDWDRLVERILARGMGGRAALNLRRKLFTPARHCALDRVGRILLPEPLRAYAGIDREAVVLGVGSHLEIWEPSRWEAAAEALDAEDVGEAILDELARLTGTSEGGAEI